MLKEGFAGTFRKFDNGFTKEGLFKGFAWVFTQGFHSKVHLGGLLAGRVRSGGLHITTTTLKQTHRSNPQSECSKPPE